MFSAVKNKKNNHRERKDRKEPTTVKALSIIPNARHGYGRDGLYMMRRRWDYFVRNLLGAEPPREYEIGKQNPPTP